MMFKKFGVGEGWGLGWGEELPSPFSCEAKTPEKTKTYFFFVVGAAANY